MSGVISFGRGFNRDRLWFCAGWGFRAVLDRVVERNSGDEALVREVRQGESHGGLHLELVGEESSELADRILRALEAVADEIVAGDFRPRVNDRELSDEEQRMLQTSVAELLDGIRRETET